MIRKTIAVLSLWALPLAASAEDFINLLDSEQVRLEEVRGTGYASGTVLDTVIRNMSGRDLEIGTVPREALFFKNQGEGQDMLVLGLVERSGGYSGDEVGTFIELPRNEALEVSLIAYCVDFEKADPHPLRDTRAGRHAAAPSTDLQDFAECRENRVRTGCGTS